MISIERCSHSNAAYSVSYGSYFESVCSFSNCVHSPFQLNRAVTFSFSQRPKGIAKHTRMFLKLNPFPNIECNDINNKMGIFCVAYAFLFFLKKLVTTIYACLKLSEAPFLLNSFVYFIAASGIASIYNCVDLCKFCYWYSRISISIVPNLYYMSPVSEEQLLV